MRIIAGKFKGRRFNPPANNWPTRPTTDYAREALFNILNNDFYFEDIKALELFGGAGSHTYELVSRGTEDVTVIEKHPGCISFIKKTVGDLDATEYVKIIRGDVFRFLEGCSEQYNYIFADPPYDLPTMDLLPDIIFKNQLLAKEGTFVLEHGNNNTYTTHPNFIKEKEYGGTIFSFFENISDEETA